MQNKITHTLPALASILACLCVLASCQREADVAVPEVPVSIGFTVEAGGDTKSAAPSPVSVTVVVPWKGEPSSSPATKVTPLGNSYFGTSHSSFGVMAYGTVASSRTLSWTDEATYDGSYGIWMPGTVRTWPCEGNEVTFFGWAPYSAATPADDSGDPSIVDFAAASDAASQVDLLVTGPVVSQDTPLASALTVPLTFTHALTAVRFASENLTITSVAIEGIYDKGTLDMASGEWSGQSSLSQTYSLTADISEESSTLMLIPQTLPSGATLTAETSAGTLTASLAGQVWEPGQVVTYKLTDPFRSPVVAGEFTVSDGGQKVRFASGNLRWTGTEFDIAPSQYYYMTTETRDWSSEMNLFPYYKCSGVSGEKGDITVFPSSNYVPSGGNDGTLTATEDWGSCAPQSGANPWRTLTSEEWTYLLTERTSGGTVNGTSQARYTEARINTDGTTVNGLIIFPDGVNFASDEAEWVSINSFDENKAWGTQCTSSQWTALEAKGCVFLPAAGIISYFGGWGRGGVGSAGYYWSSKGCTEDDAYEMSFSAYSFYTHAMTYRRNGESIRLVQNID